MALSANFYDKITVTNTILDNYKKKKDFVGNFSTYCSMFDDVYYNIYIR